MKWAIRYIQDHYWGGSTQTERGFEDWLKEDGYTASGDCPTLFDDINAAHIRMDKLMTRRDMFGETTYRYVVEEYYQ